MNISHKISFLRVGSVSELLSDEERCGGATDDYYWTHWVGAATLYFVDHLKLLLGVEEEKITTATVHNLIKTCSFVFELSFFSFFGIQVRLRLQSLALKSP